MLPKFCSFAHVNNLLSDLTKFLLDLIRKNRGDVSPKLKKIKLGKTTVPSENVIAFKYIYTLNLLQNIDTDIFCMFQRFPSLEICCTAKKFNSIRFTSLSCVKYGCFKQRTSFSRYEIPNSKFLINGPTLCI